MLVGFFEGYILGMKTSTLACGLTLAVQMNLTVSDRTQLTAVYSKSHHWNPMQTAPECFKYVVLFVSGKSQKDLRCEATPVCWESEGGVVSEQHLSYTSFRICHTSEAENHHANPVIWPRVRGSRSRLSTNPPFMDICFTSCATGQILPSSVARPWLIFCVSEQFVAFLPHRNKQMAARSWVITKPLPEWLVLDRAALICRRWFALVFAKALKSYLELRDTGCLLRLNGSRCPPFVPLLCRSVWQAKWHWAAPATGKCVWLFETSWLLIQCVCTP